MLWLWLMLLVRGGAHVELKVGFVGTAFVLFAFWGARVKATCHKEGPVRAPGGFGKPPVGRPGGCKMLFVEMFCLVFTFSIYVVVAAHVVGAWWRPREAESWNS